MCEAKRKIFEINERYVLIDDRVNDVVVTVEKMDCVIGGLKNYRPADNYGLTTENLKNAVGRMPILLTELFNRY